VYPTLILAVAALSAPMFAKYAGYELRKKPFDIVGVAGLFFLLAVAFMTVPVTTVEMVTTIFRYGFIVSYLIGWVALLVGAFWALLNVIMLPETAHPVERTYERV